VFGEDLPPELRESLERYISQRVETGSFLRAVLENDLRAACERADLQNRYRLFAIVQWLHGNAPSSCWGSTAAVHYWLAGAHR
jgi:hypothetical protein